MVKIQAGNKLPARGVPMVAPWSTDEIIYLGGIASGVCHGDGYVVNVVRGTVKKCFDSAFRFTADGNQCYRERMGKVIGLIQDDKDTLHLVSYSEGDAILQVVSKIGHGEEE